MGCRWNESLLWTTTIEQMDTIKFTETIIIEASPAKVFDFTQDYGKRLNWDTFLKKAHLIDGAVNADKGG